MRLIRTFHPIGQGAFYSERHISDTTEFTIIYDCGSSTIKGNKLEKKIKSSFPKNHNIDALFISHFHTDHINGIEILKRHCNIKKVIIPLLSPEAKTLLKLNNFIHDNYSDTQLIDNPSLYFSNDTTIISINETTGEDEIVIDNSTDISSIDDNTSFPSGTVLKSDLIDNNWLFIPFNYKHTERKSELITALQNENLQLHELDTIEKIITNKLKIIEAFKSVKGDLNENSMLLFSGNNTYYPPLNSMQITNHNLLAHLYHPLSSKSSCIYFGDINLKMGKILDDIKIKLNSLLDNVGVIQIPHHGSIHNFDSSFFENCNPMFAVISHGTTNQFGHPSDRVIGDILANNVIVCIVTENQNTLVVQWI